MAIHREFVVRNERRYTFKRNNDPFHTATLYKNGEVKGTMAVADANEYCEKWNGRRGDFEVKPAAR